ncbi:MAG: PhzF family phenazine biosynthesis protein [Burkholderiales bacterium]|nr:PhzF family phenazine biosynthesis protein [Burkholderiales bacterium]
MRLDFRLVNVFTDGADRLSGNPLAVFEDGSGLDAARMQDLARQFNLSETTFILPSARASAAVRIFTPAMELPFAGHPVLGTAQVIADLRGGDAALTLDLAAGVVPVRRDADGWTLTAAAPSTRAFDAGRTAALVAALGLTAADLAAAPLWVSTGMEQLLVPLADARRVAAATPGAGLAQFGNDFGKVGVYLFAAAGTEEVSARFFFGKAGGPIAEDPATGSACANLGGFLLARGTAPPFRRAVRQGGAVGRPSRLGLAVDAAGGIQVSGAVIALGRGHLEL